MNKGVNKPIEKEEIHIPLSIYNMINKPYICAVCSNPPFKQHEIAAVITAQEGSVKTTRSCSIKVPICERCYKMHKKNKIKWGLYVLSGLGIIAFLGYWILELLGSSSIYIPCLSFSLIIFGLCCILIYFGRKLSKEIDDRYLPSKQLGISIPDFEKEPTVWGTNPEFFKTSRFSNPILHDYFKHKWK